MNPVDAHLRQNAVRRDLGQPLMISSLDALASSSMTHLTQFTATVGRLQVLSPHFGENWAVVVVGVERPRGALLRPLEATFLVLPDKSSPNNQ